MQSCLPLTSALIPAVSILLSAPIAQTQTDIPGSGNATVNGGTNSTNYHLTADAVAEGYGIFSGNFTANTFALTIESDFPGALSFNGSIAGSATSPDPTLTIFGSKNTVILNGNNTFTGDVVIESGTLPSFLTFHAAAGNIWFFPVFKG